jgi:hypothetical protein
MFFDMLGEELGFKETDDWYNLTVKDVHKHGGEELLSKYYHGSLILALQQVYEGHEWYPWKFSQNVPARYWDNIEHQKKFLDWVGKELGVKDLPDWYVITNDIISNYGGSGILAKYGKSPSKMLQAIYPSHNWIAWKFKQVSKRYWDLEKSQKEFVEWLSPLLHIKDLNDWYRVSLQNIERVASGTAFNKFDKAEILRNVYPHHSWDLDKLTKRIGPIKASQRMLGLMVKEIFPNTGKKRLFGSSITFSKK